MSVSQKRSLRIILVSVTLAIGIVLGIWQVKPPNVDETSHIYPAYQRMMENIRENTQHPHPIGSDEIKGVRENIVAEIEAMGLTPLIEEAGYTEAEIINDEWFAEKVGEDGSVSLKNILVKLDAPETGRMNRSMIFVSHYDSVAGGPGAADDMLGVCAMLEAVRAQAHNTDLNSTVYFLFTEGEEDGMLGAWKFIEAHPEMEDKIDMMINLEARGNRGGVLLFQTSPQAYSLLKVVKNSGAKPIGFSSGEFVYAILDTYTDFTAFLRNGYKGINLAAIEGVEHYHEPTDSYEKLDRSTAWHYLAITLALADYAANHSLDELSGSSTDAVFFPFFPGMMVIMTYLESVFLSITACGVALAFGAVQAKRGQLKVDFSTVLIGSMVLLAIGSTVFFMAGSYLFSIPLLVVAITAFLRKWTIPYLAAQMVSGVVILLLWVPSVFLLWVSLIQPVFWFFIRMFA
ncbi:MAG: M20/M25/M40 family metallo-hydrolase [Peptococcaceae bacterium]|nr:M20/M25/M40 family metallo-hydrolase [Peptococcaceae bacterium]